MQEFRQGINQALTDAVSAFAAQTTEIARAVMEVIGNEPSVYHKPPFAIVPRTAADRNAELQAALAKAKNVPTVQEPTRSQTPQRPQAPSPQVADVPHRTLQEPRQRSSPASSIVNMDTDEVPAPAPAPMVGTIGNGMSYQRAPWASLIKQSQDKEYRSLVSKPRSIHYTGSEATLIEPHL